MTLYTIDWDDIALNAVDPMVEEIKTICETNNISMQEIDYSDSMLVIGLDKDHKEIETLISNKTLSFNKEEGDWE